MRDAIEMMAGFKDIKNEFRTKRNVTKSNENLVLWFTVMNNILFVHDYEDHKKCLAIATIDSATKLVKKIFLYEQSRGRKLIIAAVAEKGSADPAINLNRKYRLCGSIPLKFLK